ncbi:MAG: cbb3-type cytochrome c oxidase subunit II, partial [Candidatus Thiodiazotropha sp.]
MANDNQNVGFQEKMEKNIWLFLIVLALALSVGGIVEIVPLFTIDETWEHNEAPELVWQRQPGQTLHDHKPGDGMRPYTAMELAGRDIYQREGCYLC